jgi:hypothetical protein
MQQANLAHNLRSDLWAEVAQALACGFWLTLGRRPRDQDPQAAEKGGMLSF